MRACEWYPKLIANNIPTPKSIILSCEKELAEVYDEIFYNLEEYPFVRMCNASPKDHGSCIFNDVDDVMSALHNSASTSLKTQPNDHGIHVMLREVIQIDFEARCFWNDGRLTAVSCHVYLPESEREKFEIKVINFFKRHKIPYDCCAVDLGYFNGELIVIELNEFGLGSKASAELFDWKEDYCVLYQSIYPIFRYKNEFDW